MGPCTANAQGSTVDSRCHGTTIICCVADLRRCLPTTSGTGVQQSTRYCRALPCQHLCMMTPSLYVTRSATSSQCKSSCKIPVRQWSTEIKCKLYQTVIRHCRRGIQAFAKLEYSTEGVLLNQTCNLLITSHM